MQRDQYQEELDKIFTHWRDCEDQTRKKIKNILQLAAKEIGDHLLSNGFIHQPANVNNSNEYYYDPKTRVGVAINIPNYVEITSDHNVIMLDICYKVGKRFFHYTKSLYFFYKREEPEKVFSRFKKYNGPTARKEIKEYLKTTYSNNKTFIQDMLIEERADKLKELNKK